MNDIPSLSQTFDQNGGLVSYGNDARLLVTFVTRPVLQGAKSRDQGKPVYENVAHIRIQQPGERDVIDRPVTEQDKARFPRQWMQFEAGKAQTVEGTPLHILFPDNPSVVETLHYHGVRVIEQLAVLSDTQKQNIGLGAHQWIDLAKAFLAKADDGKDFHAILDRISKLEIQVSEKDRRIAALEAELDAVDDEPDEAPPHRRRGRPPKNAALT